MQRKQPMKVCACVSHLTAIAIAEDPRNVKALHRRAIASETLGGWTNLHAALKGTCFLAPLSQTSAYGLQPCLKTTKSSRHWKGKALCHYHSMPNFERRSRGYHHWCKQQVRRKRRKCWVSSRTWGTKCSAGSAYRPTILSYSSKRAEDTLFNLNRRRGKKKYRRNYVKSLLTLIEPSVWRLRTLAIASSKSS